MGCEFLFLRSRIKKKRNIVIVALCLMLSVLFVCEKIDDDSSIIVTELSEEIKSRTQNMKDASQIKEKAWL